MAGTWLVKRLNWYKSLVLLCATIGLSAFAYGVIKADPILVMDDLRLLTPYTQLVSRHVPAINADAASVAQECGQFSAHCESAANELDLAVRSFREDLARATPPPCLESRDHELRAEMQDYAAVTPVILADSSANASRAEAVAAIALVTEHVTQSTQRNARCGLARLDPFLPSS